LQFVSPVAGFANHFIAGDLYIDPARKIVSLVSWDSVSRFDSALSRELEDVLPDGFTLVSHEIRTNIQRLDTGCRQCSLQFTEEMKGYVAPGQIEFEPGRAAAEAAGQRLMVHLTITLDGVRRFIADPDREGTAEGWIEWATWPGRIAVDEGTFNLFTAAGDPTVKWMRYRLYARDPADTPVTVSGFKRVRDDPGMDVWSDTSTLYTRIFQGHVTLDQEGGAEVLGAGVINVHLLDFLHQLTTFDVEAASEVERLAILAEFGRFFMGRLWDVYARRVLSYAPM
jgi:cholesterol oxidase